MKTLAIFIAMFMLLGCNTGKNAESAEVPQSDQGDDQMTQMKLSSTSFENEGPIPKKHTCQGEDISPALQWAGIPEGTKSIALIVDDPDAPDPAAPKMVWVHWVLYNIPIEESGLAENIKQLPQGTLEGKNDWKETGWKGPCPPIGRHRYYHKLFALNAILPDLKTPTKADLETAMKGHIIGQTQLMGTYQKE